MKLNKLIPFFSLFAIMATAQAAPITVNFQDMADGSYGESAWKPLNLNADFGLDVDISGVYDSREVYAYLDSDTAGLGVCRGLYNTSKANTKFPNSGSNLCNPSNDDNVNTYNGLGETLRFAFNEGMTVSKIWFNNNHDPDYGMDGDTVIIGGVNHTFSGGPDDSDLGWLFEFSGTDGVFSASDILDISYYVGGLCGYKCDCLRGEEFYISAMEFSKVPEPTVLPLLGIGLIGVFGVGSLKRRRSDVPSATA